MHRGEWWEHVLWLVDKRSGAASAGTLSFGAASAHGTSRPPGAGSPRRSRVCLRFPSHSEFQLSGTTVSHHAELHCGGWIWCRTSSTDFWVFSGGVECDSLQLHGCLAVVTGSAPLTGSIPQLPTPGTGPSHFPLTIHHLLDDAIRKYTFFPLQIRI